MDARPKKTNPPYILAHGDDGSGLILVPMGPKPGDEGRGGKGTA